MARDDYKDVSYWSDVEFQSKGKTYKGKFYNWRINRESVPSDLFMYECCDDGSRGDVIAIAKGIMVNFWGTLITEEPLPLDDHGYMQIDCTLYENTYESLEQLSTDQLEYFASCVQDDIEDSGLSRKELMDIIIEECVDVYVVKWKEY